MSLRARFVAYLVGLQLSVGAMAVLLLRERPLWLACAEAALVLCAWYGVRLVRALFEPLDLLRTGGEMLSDRDFSTTFRPIGQPEMDGLIEIYNRMLSGLREERLRRQEQAVLLENVLQASPAAVVTLDFDGQVSLANPRAVALFAAGDVVGRRLVDLAPLGPACLATPPGASTVVPLAGGRRLKVACAEIFDRGFPRRLYVAEELTEELRASERSAYGKLIRMMSHEINNSAGAVGSLLDSLRVYGAALDEEDRRAFLDAITVAIQRLRRLETFTSGFADVVRLPSPEPRPCDLGDLIREVLVLWQPQFDERRIVCTFEQEAGLAPVALDRNQLELVLVNVLKNAQEAIGESGRIAIQLGHEATPGGEAFAPLLLSVRDSGPGLPPGSETALFEPFHSTKSDGRGLGLTVVREILARHGFTFALENGPAGGAEFSIRFS